MKGLFQDFKVAVCTLDLWKNAYNMVAGRHVLKAGVRRITHMLFHSLNMAGPGTVTIESDIPPMNCVETHKMAIRNLVYSMFTFKLILPKSAGACPVTVLRKAGPNGKVAM